MTAPRERTWLGALLAAVTLVYLPGVLGLPLDWDDPVWLRDPIHAMPPGEAVVTAFTTTRDHVWAPLLRLSFAGLLAIGRGSIALVHLASLGLYLGSIAGLYALVRRLAVPPAAALVALAAWALHPSKVECVAWLTGLKDVQSLALLVGSALVLTPGSPAATPRGTLGLGRIAVGTALGVAALLTKGATFPVVAVLAVIAALPTRPGLGASVDPAASRGRTASALVGSGSVGSSGAPGAAPNPAGGRAGEALRRFAALGLAAAVVAAIGAAAWQAPVDHPAPWRGPVLAGWVHGALWSRLLWPAAPAAITPIPAEPWPTIALGLVLTGVGGAAAARWPRVGVPLVLLWVLPQLPFLGVAPMAFWASDRHLLIPSLAPLLAIALALEAALRDPSSGEGPTGAVGGSRSWRGRGWAWVVPALVLAWLAGISAARVADWRDSLRLWETEVRRPGQHFARWYKLGVARGSNQDFAGAEQAFDRALELSPGRRDAVAHRLVASLAKDGWTEQDGALVRIIEPPPADAAGWRRAFDALTLAGRGDLADWARAELARAVEPSSRP